MNETRQIFRHDEFGTMDVLTIDGEAYFPATRCAQILGFPRPQKAVADHCMGVVKRDGISRITNQYDVTTEQMVQFKYIPESDLRRLMLRANSPAREGFAVWIYGDILPALRRKQQISNSVSYDGDLPQGTLRLYPLPVYPIGIIIYKNGRADIYG